MAELFRYFFTHKDFLPGQLPGTLFTPLHFAFSACCIGLVAFACLHCRNKSEEKLRRLYAVLWMLTVVLEVTKILWESLCGAAVRLEWTGVLPLYPCSIFMYAMPFAIWGRGNVRTAACGYVCSLGLLGGAINFVYPANVLSNYSCLSFAGFHTFFYHGTMVFTAATMLLTGYHRYTGIKRWQQLLLPAVPFALVSLVANGVNFSPIGSDYMFFRLDSFIFAPIGQATPEWLSVLVVYVAYGVIHALPYLPSYLHHCAKSKVLEE